MNTNTTLGLGTRLFGLLVGEQLNIKEDEYLFKRDEITGKKI